MTDPIKIYVIQTDTAGCAYQRLDMPLDALVRKYPGEFDVCRQCEPKSGNGPSVVIGQRIAGNDLRWRELCADPGIFAVYDLDDDLIDLDPGNAVPYSIYQPIREDTIRNIAAADHVMVSTANLAAKISQWNANVSVAVNCVADDAVVERAPEFGDPPVIAWAGSMFHQQDFPPELVAQFAKVRDAIPTRWVSIGHNYFGWGSTFGWGPISTYHTRLQFVDFGLAPISHTPFNASKSWIKALDYMAKGVIPVVSDWGQYPELVDTEMNGLIVDDYDNDPTGWIEDLAWLLEHPSTWPAMRADAQATARQYIISNQIDAWASVYRKAREL